MNITRETCPLPCECDPISDWNCKGCDIHDEHDFLENGKYEDIVEHFMANPPAYSFFYEFLLGKLRNEDLPLFINFQWNDVQEKYLSRLKGGHNE